MRGLGEIEGNLDSGGRPSLGREDRNVSAPGLASPSWGVPPWSSWGELLEVGRSVVCAVIELETLHVQTQSGPDR